MFENDHRDEFDQQIRSILENGQEEVPASVWNGVSAGLDKAAGGKVVKLWLWRSGIAAAVAAAVAGFFFIDRTQTTVEGAAEEMIAVVEPPVIQVDDSHEITIQDIERPHTSADLICKAEVDTEPAPAPVEEQVVENVAPTAETPHEEEQEPAITHTTAAPDTPVHPTDKNEDIWTDQEPAKRKIKTSIVLAGLAGTNNPSQSGFANPFRSPAIDRVPTKSSVQPTGSQTTYGIPLSFGLGVKINFTERWALSAGVNYTLLTSKFDGKYIEVNDGIVVSQISSKVKNSQHYIGIPINAYYNILKRDFINFYAYAGGAVEMCMQNKYAVLSTPVINHTEKTDGVQLSANAGIGVEFLLGKHVGLYIDPSLRYYFNGDQPKSIRTAQPLMLGFEMGFRFNL